MSRHVVVLINERLRQRAIEYVRSAKPGSRVQFMGPQRSTNKNAKMWAMLGDIAEQIVWQVEGTSKRIDTESWKRLFLDALHREHRDRMLLVPNIDHTGFVNIGGNSSSELDDEEMGDMLSIMSAFGDQHGVVWSEPAPKGDDQPLPPIEAYEETH